MTGAQPALLYDGTCRFCTAQAARLRRLAYGRVAMESAYAPGVREQYPSLPQTGLLGEIKLVDADGRVFGGAAAIARVFEIRGGALAALARLYRFRAARFMADRVYAAIARRRYRLAGRCDDGSCPAE